MEIKRSTLDFLFSSYFGVTPDQIEQVSSAKDKQELIQRCAKRAYLDFNRTLRFTSSSEKQHRLFYEKMVEKFVPEMQGLIESNDSSFDKNHAKICTMIISSANEDDELREEFCYGQAQKWLNMTLKYMMLLGVWEKEFERIMPLLHVPVDSYILKAASSKGQKNAVKDALDISDLPLKPGKESHTGSSYNSDYHLAWSKWNEENYCHFQKTLKQKIESSANFATTIEWEGVAWIEQAKLESLK